MAKEPLMVDGTGGFPTEVMKAAGETVRVKSGAEGVFCAALPTLGAGVALKIADGAGRAAEVVMGAILVRLGVLDDVQQAVLARLLRPVLKNVAGREVGEIRPVAGLRD
jgi:L-asparaginase II